MLEQECRVVRIVCISRFNAIYRSRLAIFSPSYAGFCKVVLAVDDLAKIFYTTTDFMFHNYTNSLKSFSLVFDTCRQKCLEYLSRVEHLV